MARDLSKRLENLRAARRGPQSMVKAYTFADSAGLVEKFDQRAKTPGARYALGAMQEVDPSTTDRIIADGDRVCQQIANNVSQAVEFEYQGSVPLNVHVRYGSDVDVLVLLSHWKQIDWSGPAALAGGYTARPGNGSLIDDVLGLRAQCENTLVKAYPQARVDQSGAKSIAISGGSLSRKVDVVPSHWYDNANYQRTGDKRHREIAVVDKNTRERIYNRPFMYMSMIEDRDTQCFGGAKKVIRLLKALRNDFRTDADLSSYDIGSLVWHIPLSRLIVSPDYELGLINVAADHLRAVADNEALARSLQTPDGSRLIFDESKKFRYLRFLTNEIDQLVADIAEEINPFTSVYPTMRSKVLAEARM